MKFRSQKAITFLYEKYFCLGEVNGRSLVAPTCSDIEGLVKKIMKGLELGVEFAVVAAAYMDILEECGVVMTISNWRCIVLVSFLTATKVWIDENVWNVDFIEHVFPNMTTKDLYRLEFQFLETVEFKVGVQASAYSHYQGLLIAVSMKKRSRSCDFLAARIFIEYERNVQKGQIVIWKNKKWKKRSVHRKIPTCSV